MPAISICRSRGVGAYVAGETHNLAYPRTAKPNASPGVLLLTGSHSTADTEFTAADALGRVTALAQAGFVVMSGNLGQPAPPAAPQGTFGNDTSITRVGQMKTFLQGTAPVPAAAGKVHITGGSGGAAAAINYALRNPASVASLYLMVPLTDLEDFYNSRTDATIPKTEVDAAYGGAAAFAAAVPSHSPIRQNLAPLAGMKVRLVYSTNDPYVPVSTVTNFVSAATAAGAIVSTFNQGAAGHAATGVPASDVVSHVS